MANAKVLLKAQVIDVSIVSQTVEINIVINTSNIF